jgi:MoaA/NifB/PqqE/SkfB family radical SAM enzyme
MCDIWKDNRNLKQLTEKDIRDLLVSLEKLGTQQVVMSGGEALLNPNFFLFCDILRSKGIRVTLLSTGLTLSKHAAAVTKFVSEVIVSLDGDAATHNYIRNIPGAFESLAEGVLAIKTIDPSLRITGRTVIHRINFRVWPAIIDTARKAGLDQVSFLPADVSSHAFNREVLWSDQRQHEILPDQHELPEMREVLEKLIEEYSDDFSSGFIAEDAVKLRKICQYYAACYNEGPFPYKKCNAPWVSAVVEADGSVKPCFFHASLGNIREMALDKILNSQTGMQFRKELDMATNPTCVKCVCYLHLSPGTNLS